MGRQQRARTTRRREPDGMIGRRMQNSSGRKEEVMRRYGAYGIAITILLVLAIVLPAGATRASDPLNFIATGQNLAAFGANLGDLDGDGDLDVLVGTVRAADQVWLNDSTGIFVDTGQRLGYSYGFFGQSLGDLDGDGDLDTFIPNSGSSRVWFNNGSGIFTGGQTINTGDTMEIALGDLDADGDLDAYVANAGSRSIGEANRVYFNNGNGSFSDTGQRLSRGRSVGVALGDLDSDGDLDAFVGNGHQLWPNEVWLNNGYGVFGLKTNTLGNENTKSVYLGDVDADGDLDAFAVGSNAGASQSTPRV